MRAEVVVNYHCALAEGPLWHPDHKALYWTDIDACHIYRLDPASGVATIYDIGAPVGGMTLQQDGSLLLFMNLGRIMCFDGTALRPVDTDMPDGLDARFNDAIADGLGRVFCGLLPGKSQSGCLYRVEPSGHWTRLLTHVGCSNGLGFTRDGRRLYHSDSSQREISLFDYGAETGEITNRQPFWKSPSTETLPDGLTVDSEDYIWTAQWGGGCVIRLSPDGREDGRIETSGARYVTSVAFGGEDLQDLFITTAAQGDSPGSNGGAIFRARPGIAGCTEFRSDVSPLPETRNRRLEPK
jgi:sugar lactone lactonase YvrE